MRGTELTPSGLATALSIREDELWKLAESVESFFKPQRTQLVGRKQRTIDAMYSKPKKLYRRLHKWFQRQRMHHPAAYGAIRNRSCFLSAQKHLGRQYLWTLDARDCYPSITPEAMLAELISLGFSNTTASILTQLFTVRGHIPQGSPISGDALNIFFWRVDQQLASFCGSHNLSYTRFADDFEITGDDRLAGDQAAALVIRLLSERNIEINRPKFEKRGFSDRSKDQLVHNIVVNDRRGTKINRSHRRTALTLAESYLAACKSVQPSSLAHVARKRSVIHGWMHHCRQAHFSPARHIRKLLQAGDRIVRRKLSKLGLSASKGRWWITSGKRNEPGRLSALWRERVASHMRAPTAPLA